MPGVLCTIDLGKKTDPRSPQFRIALIRDAAVRTSIQGYLTVHGVELDRSNPPGWFQWLDDEQTIFQARCAEPSEHSDGVDDGYQPYNYFVQARLSRPRPGLQNALGEDFFHEKTLLAPL
jgi:hypothetical protein